MSVASDKPHLKYESVTTWMEGENVPPLFMSIADDELRDKYITQFGELRRYLFAKHLATLTPEERGRSSRKTNIHPSTTRLLTERSRLPKNLSESCEGWALSPKWSLDGTILIGSSFRLPWKQRRHRKSETDFRGCFAVSRQCISGRHRTSVKATANQPLHRNAAAFRFCRVQRLTSRRGR